MRRWLSTLVVIILLAAAGATATTVIRAKSQAPSRTTREVVTRGPDAGIPCTNARPVPDGVYPCSLFTAEPGFAATQQALLGSEAATREAKGRRLPVSLRQYDIVAGRCVSKTLSLEPAGDWSGEGDRTFVYSAGVSPWVLTWEWEVKSSLARRFDVGIAFKDAWVSAIPWGGEADTPYSRCNNHSVRTEQGAVTVYVRASGVHWRVRTYREP